MRAKNFTDLTQDERVLLNREIGKAKEWIHWSWSNKQGYHYLSCSICDGAIIKAINGEVASKLYRQYTGYVDFWYLKKFYIPHMNSATHQYNSMMGKLAGGD